MLAHCLVVLIVDCAHAMMNHKYDKRNDGYREIRFWHGAAS